ncbi:Outer membrane receptor for monomeric catechols [Raoultella terrigena]|uniref:Outer membrane receptor for monomeric catechols n=1 Tax=Raoultella terrigena TaxID=577 RepID=A0A3P8KY24_RAOTE|nr:Outer membrane receptor for monomeric catechols [Raoultella terrigena]
MEKLQPRDGGTQKLGSSTLDDSPDYERPDYPDFTDRYHSATTTQHVFLFNDTLTFSPQWSLLLSGSESLFTVDNYGKSSQRSSSHDDRGTSGSASLMYKPVDNLTLYTTWANSMQQGDTAPAGANNAGEVLSPYAAASLKPGPSTRCITICCSPRRCSRPSARLPTPTTAVISPKTERRKTVDWS